MSLEFCDTSIFVYAYDLGAGPKRDRALDLTARLWQDRAGATSVQILQELFSILTRELKPAVPAAEPVRLSWIRRVGTSRRWMEAMWS